MTKVKVLKWTASAKPLKTNNTKQNITIQESSVILEIRINHVIFDDVDESNPDDVAPNYANTCIFYWMAVENEHVVFKGGISNCETLTVHFLNAIVWKSSGYKH